MKDNKSKSRLTIKTTTKRSQLIKAKDSLYGVTEKVSIYFFVDIAQEREL